MVSYIGHGQKTFWAAEHLYDATALAQLTNTGRLTIMLPMTCNEGYFIDPEPAQVVFERAGGARGGQGCDRKLGAHGIWHRAGA